MLHLNRMNQAFVLAIQRSRYILGGAYKDLNVDDIPAQNQMKTWALSFNTDWHINDENIVNIEDIISTCQKINIINNEYIPQIFVLNDNLYAFAKA